MRIILLSFLALMFAHWQVLAQDTFSIVAVDSITGEVGAAGASCVDLSNFGELSDHFLAELFPGDGAIATQAWYQPSNQINARNQMMMGEHPDSIIQWLVDNDVQARPDLRQYGIAAIYDDVATSAAHTGSNTDDYKGHITGPGYSIQGNILSGAEILEQMEQQFLEADGDLACRLMAALQGANEVGADSRCSSNGTSSLFAFVKVSQPDANFGQPSFVKSVRTKDGDGIEPIDSVQALFDLEGLCGTSSSAALNLVKDVTPYPNPCGDVLRFTDQGNRVLRVKVISSNGQTVLQQNVLPGDAVKTGDLASGTYIVQVVHADSTEFHKIVKL